MKDSMKRKTLTLMAMSLVLATSASAQIANLGCLGIGPPWLGSFAYAINANGEATGYYTDGGYSENQYPFIYTGGNMVNLGPLSTGYYQIYNYGEDINDSSMVAGWGYTETGNWRSVRWLTPGSPIRLDPVGADVNSFGFGCNNAGVIVGATEGSVRQAARWNTGLTTGSSLGIPSGWTNGEAVDINNSDVIAGNGYTGAARRAYKIVGGVWIPLGTLSEFSTYRARKIGDNGWVVGTMENDHFDNRAVVWDADGTPKNLGVLPYPSHNGSRAYGLNGVGEVVGASYEAFVQSSQNRIRNQKAFIWSSALGMVDLNEAFASEGWNLVEAYGINNAHQITGWGISPQSEYRAFITPPFVPSGVIQGHLDLPGFGGDPSARPFVIEIRRASTLNFVQRVTVYPDSSGNFTFNTPMVGTYDVSCKGLNWLRSSLSGVSISASGATVNFTQVNGDIDGDNEVGIGDYAVLSSSYGSADGDPNYQLAADLAGEGEVSISSYAILSANYGLLGDD